MIETKNGWYRVSTKALIYDENGRFLLCKEDTGIWDLPGGGLDHGEKPEEGLKREIFEEMGLETAWISKIPKYFITAHRPTSKNKPWVANVCYEVKVKDLNFIPSKECVDIGFFTPEEAKEINLIENVVVLVGEMMKN